MEEREGFEAALREDRYDGDTRKVFADWLDEHDCPEEADFQRAWSPQWQKAEDYIKAFCQRVDLKYTYFLEQASKFLKDDSTRIPCTLNTSNSTLDEDIAEVWRQAAILLRLCINGDQYRDPFTCGRDCYPDGLSWEDDLE